MNSTCGEEEEKVTSVKKEGVKRNERRGGEARGKNG